MSDEEIPPSDDDMFISTQIQGKLEDLDQELKKKGISDFLQNFALKETNVTVPKPSKASDDDGKAANLKTGASKQMQSSKPKKANAKLKRKPKAKKLSVTDQMIRKLSGKPQKFRQMRLNNNSEEGTTFLSTTSSQDSEDGKTYEYVFTPEEWSHLRYIFQAGDDFKGNEFSSARDGDQQDNDGLWDVSRESPSFNVEDWNSLYGYQTQRKVARVESNVLHHITLSQACQSSQAQVDIQSDKVVVSPKCEDHDDNSLSEVENSTMNENSIIELNHLRNVSFEETIECSSDEGSIIELGSSPKSDNSVIILSSQDSDVIDMRETNRTVEYKGPELKLKEGSPFDVYTNDRAEDVIPNSSDEDDISQFMELVRRDAKVIEIPDSQ